MTEEKMQKKDFSDQARVIATCLAYFSSGNERWPAAREG